MKFNALQRLAIPAAGFLACLMLFSGCAIEYDFNQMLRTEAVAELRENPKQDLKLHVVWEPASFVSRVDVKGPDGVIGSGLRPSIPIGRGLSGRIEQALQEVFIFDENSEPLVITVGNAESSFKYSYTAGFGAKNLIDTAEVIFRASYTLGDLSWSNEYTANYHDPSFFGQTETFVLEKAWDDIAVQVAKDVAEQVGRAEKRSE